MTLTMQEWIFDESYGKYSIDLGDSNVDIVPGASIPGVHTILDVPWGYGHEAGLPELREAIARLYQSVQPANILVCHGAQEAFTLLVRALDTADGNDAIVIGSGWSQHALFPLETGLVVTNVPHMADEDVLLRAIADAVTWRTKAVIVASPDNPTGWTASLELLSALSEIADVYDALLIVDENYVIDYSRSVACIDDSVAVVSGLSKMHGLPGLRVGWCIAQVDLIKRCRERKHLTTISNSVVCEMIAKAVIDENDKYLCRAKTLCHDGFEALHRWAAHVGCVEVSNACANLPFAWLVLTDGRDSLTVARRALDDGVLVIPGEVFNRPGHLRVSIGRELDVLTTGLDVLARVLSSTADAEAA